MITELPRDIDDTRLEEAIAKSHEKRFVKGWYRTGQCGLLTRTVAPRYVVMFSLAQDANGAMSLLRNTSIVEGELLLDAGGTGRVFSGCLARWQDILDAPDSYHMYEIDGHGDKRYIMRPTYLVNC